jgi:hypothetical protein
MPRASAGWRVGWLALNDRCLHLARSLALPLASLVPRALARSLAPCLAQLYLKSNAYKNLKKADGDVSPFKDVVDREKVARLLVGVDFSSADAKGGKGADKSNVRFVCEKCYDSYVAATTEKSMDPVSASLLQ